MKRKLPLFLFVGLYLLLSLPNPQARVQAQGVSPSTPRVAWANQCQATKVEVLGKGMKGLTQQSLSLPPNTTWATLQLGGVGFYKQPPRTVAVQFANEQLTIITPTRLLNKLPSISPPGMMAYTFEVQGQPGEVKVNLQEADLTKATAEGLVAYYATPSDLLLTSVGAITFQYAWGGDGSSGYKLVGPATLALTLPSPLTAPQEITVKVVVMDKDKQTAIDRRIAVVNAAAGGITASKTITNPDATMQQINIETLTLSAVPPGTTQIQIALNSPQNLGPQMNVDGAGDSMLLLGAMASFACSTEPPLSTYTETPSPTFTETPSPTFTETPLPSPTFTETPLPSLTFTETPLPSPTFTETPLPSPTFMETPLPSPTFMETPLPSPTFMETPLPSPTFMETPLPSPTFTETPLPSPTFTKTPLPSPTFTDTPSPSPTFTKTPLPSPTFTNTPLATFTKTPSPIACVPGKTVVDLGFRPNSNGYAFQNYTGVVNSTDPDFTLDQMIQWFGQDVVCQAIVNGKCETKQTALLWNLKVVNSLLAKTGRCDSMAVTALRFFKGYDSIATFLPAATTAHDLPDPSLLAKLRYHLGSYFALQVLDPVASYKNQTVLLSPAQVLSQVQTALANGATDPALIFLRSGSSGHSVLPYAIEDRCAGLYWLLVYDSNYPNETKHLVIDTQANTWSYAMANATWSGTAMSQSLGLVPISVYGQKPVCPLFLCPSKLAAAQPATNQVWVSGPGEAQVCDAQGRCLDPHQNQIPAASLTLPDSAPSFAQPIYNLPPGDYKIALGGTTLTPTALVTVSQFKPGCALAVEGLHLDLNRKDLLTTSATDCALTYRPSHTQRVTITLVVDNQEQSSQFQVQNLSITANESLTLKVDAVQKKLILYTTDDRSQTYDLQVRTVHAAGVETFSAANLLFTANDTHYWDYSQLNQLILRVDQGSDGTIDQNTDQKAKLEQPETPSQKLNLLYLPFIKSYGRIPRSFSPGLNAAP